MSNESYDRLSDTYGSVAEIKKIKADRTKLNKSNHKKGLQFELSPNAPPREVHAPARKMISTVAGTKQRMVALREMLLQDGNTKAILSKVLAMALDDEHPGQVAAIKMCVDRMMPVSMFEEKVAGQRTSITISITGIGDAKVIEGEVIDG